MKETKNEKEIQEKDQHTNEAKPAENTTPATDADNGTQDPQAQNNGNKKAKKRLKFRKPIVMETVETTDDTTKAEKREKRKARWQKIKNIASFTALAIGIGGVAYGKYAMDKAAAEEDQERLEEIEDRTAPEMGYTPSEAEDDN